MMRTRTFATLFRLLAGALMLAAMSFTGVAMGSSSAVVVEPITDVALDSLPEEARFVYARIRAGGPFKYARDGVVFRNRERLLPARPRDYYHEYTVPTPGTRTRGARRIICGGPPTTPDVCFYTDDHYRSFRRIRT